MALARRCGGFGEEAGPLGWASALDFGEKRRGWKGVEVRARRCGFTLGGGGGEIWWRADRDYISIIMTCDP